MPNDTQRRVCLSALFGFGDCFASASVGLLTAAAVRAVITPKWDMVIAMLVGMLIGTAVHLLVGLVLTPLIGALEAMVPAGLTGMYGGMYFAMRDAMQTQGPLSDSLAIGAATGAGAYVLVCAYDRVVRGVVFDSRAPHNP